MDPKWLIFIFLLSKYTKIYNLLYNLWKIIFNSLKLYFFSWWKIIFFHRGKYFVIMESNFFYYSKLFLSSWKIIFNSSTFLSSWKIFLSSRKIFFNSSKKYFCHLVLSNPESKIWFVMDNSCNFHSVSFYDIRLVCNRGKCAIFLAQKQPTAVASYNATQAY